MWGGDEGVGGRPCGKKITDVDYRLGGGLGVMKITDKDVGLLTRI